MEIIILLSAAILLLAIAKARTEYRLYKELTRKQRHYQSINDRTELNSTKKSR